MTIDNTPHTLAHCCVGIKFFESQRRIGWHKPRNIIRLQKTYRERGKAGQRGGELSWMENQLIWIFFCNPRCQYVEWTMDTGYSISMFVGSFLLLRTKQNVKLSVYALHAHAERNIWCKDPLNDGNDVPVVSSNEQDNLSPMQGCMTVTWKCDEVIGAKDCILHINAPVVASALNSSQSINCVQHKWTRRKCNKRIYDGCVA